MNEKKEERMAEGMNRRKRKMEREVRDVTHVTVLRFLHSPWLERFHFRS